MPCRRFFVLLEIFSADDGRPCRECTCRLSIRCGGACEPDQQRSSRQVVGNPISTPQGACIALDLAGPKERYSFFGGYCDLQNSIPRDDLALAAVVAQLRERTAGAATHQDFGRWRGSHCDGGRRAAGSRGLSSGSCGRPKMSLHIRQADAISSGRTDTERNGQ